MTPENLENTTAGDPVADPTTHIKVDGFDSHVPEVIDLDTPREGVPWSSTHLPDLNDAQPQ